MNLRRKRSKVGGLSTRKNIMRCCAVSKLALLVGALACSPSVHALNGTVETVTFTGQVTGRPVTFSLYLPPGYRDGTNRYPVIVHLHGLGGAHNSPQISTVPASHEAAVAAGLIEPCLIAFPDGYRDSFWADSANSAKPAETNVRLEMLPYLDANYRTIASRQGLAIQGFSMGGFGAAKFAAKFPDTFCACVIYDGAMLDWTQFQQRHAIPAAEIFDNDSVTFDSYSPWTWLEQNAATLRASLPFRQAVGVLLTENRAYRDALLAESVTPDYVETGLPHSLGPLLDAEGANSWAFIAAAFARKATQSFSLRLQVPGKDATLRWASQPGDRFQVEHRDALAPVIPWQLLATNLLSVAGGEMEYTHANALNAPAGFYRVIRHAAITSSPPAFTFNWDGTNFTYLDAQRAFTGIMLKPAGAGPFAGIIINHGAGGSANGYSLTKAREMLPWGSVCIAPNLTHAGGGETNAPVIGHSPENLARGLACANVLASLSYVDTNRLAVFGHSMGAFATIGHAAALTTRIRAAGITAGGVIPDNAPGGTDNASPTVTEANPVRSPFVMFHCDGDPVVPAMRSERFQQLLNGSSVLNQRFVISSNSIPNSAHWHNLHQDSTVNASILTNTRTWFQAHGVLP